MSSNIVRRTSSKQGLQNLLRLTAQRSIEDAEEIERERRRRARELSCSCDTETDSRGPFQDSSPAAADSLPENELKSNEQLAQEEDEGFSDWSHKIERSRQQHPENHGQTDKDRNPWSGVLTPRGEDMQEQKLGQRRKKTENIKEREDVLKKEEISYRQGDRGEVEERQKNEEVKVLMKAEKVQREDKVQKVKDKMKEPKVSYVSTVFLEQEMGPTDTAADGDGVISPLVPMTKIPRGSRQAQEGVIGVGAFQEPTHHRHHQREAPGLEKTQQEQTEAQLEGMRSGGQEELTPEHPSSISERTESLNQFLKKSNSTKKTQNPVAVSKIDDRLEQYAHAIESSSKEAKSAKQVQLDLHAPPEPVASKKNFFEGLDAWNQKLSKSTPSKDAEGLKVGVSDLINQWVRGSPDDSGRNSSPRPADVKSGDVLHKKNLWETLGDSRTSGQKNKGTTSLKKYKFVVMGHGKYEKIPVDDEHHDEYTNGQSRKNKRAPLPNIQV
ncbi:lymphocyte-specific protein 1-like isoform X1 [Scleropages formosus]|uniref:lymphocyte-specific protein 1-like isoform X1 n=1 Tax=Scleropages formosus TaxID=113540 RepID=UPI0010FA704D|nr:lymphocyte-specific protein 1-like isoform X1 [Scleropages formosus]